MTTADRTAAQHRDHLFGLALQDGFELDEFLEHFDPPDRQHEISATAGAGQCWDYTLRYELHHRQSLDCAISETQLFTSTSSYGRVVDVGCGTGGASSFLASELTSSVSGAVADLAGNQGRSHIAGSGLIVCGPVFLDGHAPRERFFRPSPAGPNLRWDVIRIGGVDANLDV